MCDPETIRRKDDWEDVTLGDHVNIFSGVAPSKVKLDAEGRFPYIKVDDLNNSTKYQVAGREYTNEKKGIAPAGSLIFPKRGAAILTNKIRIALSDMAMDTNLMAVQPNDTIDLEFFYYAIEREGLFKIADTSTIPQLNNKHINPYTLCIPPISEQKSVAEILRTWDIAIETLKKLRTLNLRRRVWFRTHLFTGRVRFPGLTGKWSEVPLHEVLVEQGLKSTGTEEVYSVSVHKGLVNQVEHLGRSFAAEETGHYNRVLPGDLVYTKSPTGDFPLGIIKQSKIDREVIVSPLYGVFTPSTHSLGEILDAMFESPIAVRNYLHPLVQKGAKNTIAITNRRFLEGKLLLPMDEKEQSALAQLISESNTELEAIDYEIEALQRQKRGLMQKLLTGEWRVPLSNTMEAAE